MKPIPLICALFTLMVGLGWTQADESAQSPSPAPWRVAVNGDPGSLAFVPESERVNLISGGLALSSTYDSNALSNDQNPVGAFAYWVSPSISITEARTRVFWTLNCTPGFVWEPKTIQGYQANDNLDFNFQYRLSERLTARVHDNFVEQSTAFAQWNENPLLPGGNLLHQPNPSVITPLAKQLTNRVSTDLVDQIGEGTEIGSSGYLNTLNFQNTSESGVQLFDSTAWSGDAFLSHRLSEHNSIGVTYSFQKIATFGQINEHSQAQSGLFFFTRDFRPGLTLSLFAGPDQTTTNDRLNLVLGPFTIPVNQTTSKWLTDGGAAFSWQGQKTSAQLNLIHRVTDGAGLTGAVEIYCATLALRRQLSKTWTGVFETTYGDNNPLSHLYGYAFSGLNGTVGLDRMLGEHFSLSFRYGRDSQHYNQFELTGASSEVADNHNRGWISVGYRFSRPLGR